MFFGVMIEECHTCSAHISRYILDIGFDGSLGSSLILTPFIVCAEGP
ncbi:hypothetical protein SLEP1_g52037 [Rubroshorea leprosula]|uniref:Uncharacterized protein n=1 Tax=Rubroshorea leprosula TaxID=152421 RepID=A0AAV5M8F7_9ROSI|nr:hypothetical protein SLEP1_g52037 [Rubroshorea leprosula]